MYRFNNDYSECAHPRILKALLATSEEQYTGYGADRNNFVQHTLYEVIRTALTNVVNGADIASELQAAEDTVKFQMGQ